MVKNNTKKSNKMDHKCSVCSNYYEVCSSCLKSGVKLRGCVEDKKQGWHDNGGFVSDSNEKEKNTGSWMKWKNDEKKEK